MSGRVIALLDRPSAQSFGLVPFVWSQETAALVVHGLKGSPARKLHPDELFELIAGGHALGVDAAIELPDLVDPVAGWIGDDFVRAAAEAGTPRPEVPWETCHVAKEGRFWLAERDAVDLSQREWLEAAAQLAFAARSSAAAKLMPWVSPESDLARAAVWFTLPTETEKLRKVRWWARLHRDAGAPVSEAELVARYEEVRRRYAPQGIEGLRRLLFSQFQPGSEATPEDWEAFAEARSHVVAVAWKRGAFAAAPDRKAALGRFVGEERARRQQSAAP